jgi:quercetin dioxygenase-like cupin family protein
MDLVAAEGWFERDVRAAGLRKISRRRNTMRFALSVFACIFIARADEMGVLRKMADNKLAPMAGLPQCVTMAVKSGDPSKGAFVIVFKGTAGCMIPWHGHTATEHVMIVTGSVKVEMKDTAKTAVLGPGGYVLMPGKHVHQFTCAWACSAFVSSDAAFDIHYVDASGAEIPPETALTKKK